MALAKKVRMTQAVAYWKNLRPLLDREKSVCPRSSDCSRFRFVTGNGFPPGPLATGTTSSSSERAVRMLWAPADTMKAMSSTTGYRSCARK